MHLKLLKWTKVPNCVNISVNQSINQDFGLQMHMLGESFNSRDESLEITSWWVMTVDELKQLFVNAASLKASKSDYSQLPQW